MRLLSSIIKGGRIRNQTIVNLSERLNVPSIIDENDKADTNEVNKTIIEQEHINLLHSEAEALLDEAHQKADEILKQALKEADAIRIAAEEEKSNLLQEALSSKEALLEKTNKEADQIRDEAYQEKQEIINSIEDELAETLKSLVQYLVGEEVYNNTQWLICTIRRMLSNDSLKKDIKVLISPQMYNKLTHDQIEMIRHIKDDVTLQMSDSINDTACRVESVEGAIEYDVQQGLDKVIADIKILQNLS